MSGAFGTAVTWKGAAALRIVSVRAPPGAQFARVNDRFRLDAVTALTAVLDTPVLGLIVTCAGVAPVRSNPPKDATANVGEVPAVTGGGEMRMPAEAPTGVKLLNAP